MPDTKVPSHIAIIMDGNGRWAKENGKPRSFGHQEGLKTAKRIAIAASKLGVKYLTLYVFSTENWKRTEEEVSFLMQLITRHLKKEYKLYEENGIRVIHCGDLARLPDEVKKEIEAVQDSTKSFTEMSVNLAINYGGRDEIVRAINKWKESTDSKSCITEETLRKYLDHPDIPDPELIIRTAGEMRLSNFLLWESAYSEYYFTDKYWPDFTEEDLNIAITNFTERKRNFGAIPEMEMKK